MGFRAMDFDNNLKLEIDFIIKHNDLLAEHAIKDQTCQLLCKYKHGNNIHQNGEQQKKWNTQSCS